MKRRWNVLHHLLQFFFLNKQRHVNKLQPWGMTVGQVSFISSLEWNKHAFTPHTTPHRDHQCCLTWIPVSEIGHNMHMDPSVFVFPVKNPADFCAVLFHKLQKCTAPAEQYKQIPQIPIYWKDVFSVTSVFERKLWFGWHADFVLFLFLITVICTVHKLTLKSHISYHKYTSNCDCLALTK